MSAGTARRLPAAAAQSGRVLSMVSARITCSAGLLRAQRIRAQGRALARGVQTRQDPRKTTAFAPPTRANDCVAQRLPRKVCRLFAAAAA